MADVITRFKLETTQYDSKLRDASKGLAEYTRQATLAGNEFGKFTQKNVEAARALGSLTPSATNAKDKVKGLVGAFNDAARAYNSLTKEQQQSDFGKAMAESIKQLNDQLKIAKQELYGVGDAVNKAGGGGLFSGLGDKMSGALQVFAGNMLTKAAGPWPTSGSEMVGMVQQGVELAKQGEGIRIAFERLGRGDILDGLREATHGTVTDLELMKAAVKFNDFKLPLDQLGTMLAFAQQKAKDTGQSVDYMVESITNGLGRQSKPILDNLGISAKEIEERMKSTGDFTKAVGEIIREQMSKAGDYVETAADRAAQADVKLKNAMEDLGRTFQPLTDAGNGLWNSIKVGALNALNTAVKPLIQALSEAGALGQGARATAGFGNLGGKSKVDRMIGRLGNGKSAGAYSIYQQQLGEFDKYINNKRFQIAAYGGDNSSIAQSAKAKLQTELDEALKMREEYVKRAQALHEQVPSPADTTTTTTKTHKGGGNTKTEPTYAPDSIAAMEAEVSNLTKLWKEAGAAVRDDYAAQLAEAKLRLDTVTGKNSSIAFSPEMAARQLEVAQGKNVVEIPLSSDLAFDEWLKEVNAKLEETKIKPIQIPIEAATDNVKKLQDTAKTTAKVVGTIGTAFNAIEDPAAKVAAVVAQAIANVALAYSDALAKTVGEKFNIWSFIAASAAAMVSMGTTIASIHQATGYAQGGMIKGNSYSGDNIGGLVDGSGLVGLNAGELVLNAAQQNNVAQNLEGAGARTVRVVGKIHGTDIILSADRTLMEQGKQLAVWGRG